MIRFNPMKTLVRTFSKGFWYSGFPLGKVIIEGWEDFRNWDFQNNWFEVDQQFIESFKRSYYKQLGVPLELLK